MGKKKSWILVAGIIMIGMFGGCGSALPAMTPEQEAQIVNYAAVLALKYDAHYESRLVDLEKYDTEPVAPFEEEPEGMDPVTDTPTTDLTTESNLPTTLEQCFQAEGAAISYQGAYYCDSYPANSTEEFYFSLAATTGKRLLVMEFQVSNTQGETVFLDFIGKTRGMRVSVNGERSTGVLSTMLMDDLATYVGALEPGEATTLVLVTEVSAEAEVPVTSMELIVSVEEGQSKILLQ